MNIDEIYEIIHSHVKKSTLYYEGSCERINNKTGLVSIKFFNTVVLRFPPLKTINRIEVNKTVSDYIRNKVNLLPITGQDWFRLDYVPEVLDIILENIINVFEKCYVAEPFGCCSRYVECSDALKCVNPDKKMALGCRYRQNLMNGRVFYGINKNM